MSVDKFIGIRLVAMEGDRVIALNYRYSTPRWEEGICTRVTVRVHTLTNYEVQYSVLLDSHDKNEKEKAVPGRMITVQREGIKPYEDPPKGFVRVPQDKLR